ncbi:hypothetical protein BKA70DRAFT_1427662 [Coprinopsis sp. MPI-PUGE-AT-0042]|nr:hypothetical protein BKA70DRAFT_1427662 [Coprinopsis sp. MPI-PUGE-AT-0042]
MARLGRPPVHTSSEDRHNAEKDYRKDWWKRNKKNQNRIRREKYARKKEEEAGMPVRSYCKKSKTNARVKSLAKQTELEVESPRARVQRTAELNLARARSIRNDMRVVLNGTAEEYFVQVCEDYINCKDNEEGEENLDRLSTRFNTFLNAINAFEEPILNGVGGWAPEMAEYRSLRGEIVKAVGMGKEIYEAALTGGKDEVLLRASNSLFSFLNTE